MLKQTVNLLKGLYVCLLLSCIWKVVWCQDEVSISGDGEELVLVNDPVVFDVAVQECERRNATIAAILSLEQHNQFVSLALNSGFNQDVWIGKNLTTDKTTEHFYF